MNSFRKPIPPLVRKAVLERAKYRCEYCGRNLPLEMHHTTYNIYHLPNIICSRPDKGYIVVERDGQQVFLNDSEEIFGNEDPDILLALCRECHEREHIDLAGNFWADPDEKKDYWWGFFNELDKG